MKTLVKSSKLNIKETIRIDDVNSLLTSSENNKPIPINYYRKNLIEIKIKHKNKCFYCNKISQYKCDDILYCWVHAHSFS
jgi:penicillin-binding protein-related factor A (putative recombinase)